MRIDPHRIVPKVWRAFKNDKQINVLIKSFFFFIIKESNSFHYTENIFCGQHSQSLKTAVKVIVAVQWGLFYYILSLYLIMLDPIEKFHLQGRPGHGGVLYINVVIDESEHCNIYHTK